MLFRSKKILAALVVLMATAGVAKAGIYNGTYAVTAYEGLTYGYAFNATSTNPFAGCSSCAIATAIYTYSGALNFNNTASSSPDLNSAFGYTTGNISNYSGSGTVTYNSSTVADYTSVSSYLASSGSNAGDQYGSWYSYDLGIVAAGTVLTITHDDGASVYQNGNMIGSTVYGPTAQVTDTVKLTSTSDTILYYSRQNGAPSVLQVAVPEPSGIAVLAIGLTGLGFIHRRRKQGGV